MKVLSAVFALCAISLPVQAETRNFIRFSYSGSSEPMAREQPKADYQPIVTFYQASVSNDYLFDWGDLSVSELKPAGDEQSKVIALVAQLAKLSTEPAFAAFTGSQWVARDKFWQPKTGTYPGQNETFIHLAGDEQGKVIAPVTQLAKLSTEPAFAAFTGSQWVAQDKFWQPKTGTYPGQNETFIHLAGDEQGKVIAPVTQLAKLSTEPAFAAFTGSQWVVPTSLTVQGW